MANKKISELTALAGASLDPATDLIEVADMSVGQSKKMTPVDFVGNALGYTPANANTTLAENFQRLAAAVTFGYQTRTAEKGGQTWSVASPTSDYPVTAADPEGIIGLKGSGTTGGLFYMASNLGAGVAINDMTLLVRAQTTGASPGAKPDLTIAFSPNQLVTNATTAVTYVGMIHLVISTDRISLGICSSTSPLTFDAITPNGLASSDVKWFLEDVTASLALNVKFTIHLRREGNTLYLSALGREISWTDSRISTAMFNWFWVETNALSAASYDNYWWLYDISVNQPLNSAPFGTGTRQQFSPAMSRNGVVDFPVGQKWRLLSAPLAFGTPDSTYSFVTDNKLATEKNFYKRGAGSTEYAMSGSNVITTLDQTSTTSNNLSSNWFTIGTPVLGTLGDWAKQTIFFDLPTANTKEIAVYITGSSQFTTGSITDTGAAMLTIYRRHSGASDTNQLFFDFVGPTTRKTGFADLSGDNGPQIRVLATTANGDVKARYIVPEMFIQ